MASKRDALTNGFKVKEAVKKLLRSGPLKTVLDKFHQRMSEMDCALAFTDGKVSFTTSKEDRPDVADDIFIESLLRRARFESTFEPYEMQLASELGKELKNRQAELFSDKAFLSGFSEILANSKNADDLDALASLCQGVCSVHLDNPVLASMEGSPELVIEYAKGIVKLALSRPPELRQPVQQATGDQTEKKARKRTAPADNLVIEQLSMEEATEVLKEKLSALGVDEDYLNEISESYSHEENITFLLNLENIASGHGGGIALLAVYRNAEQLSQKANFQLSGTMLKKINKSKTDTALRERHAEALELLTDELSLPEDAAAFLLHYAKTAKVGEKMLLSNIKVFQKHVPENNFKRAILQDPRILVLKTYMVEFLKDYLSETELDKEKIIDELLELSQGKRSEAFIRNFVEANTALLSLKTVEEVWRHLHYCGVDLQRRTTNKGIPKEFSAACLEQGILDFNEIQDRYNRNKKKLEEMKNLSVEDAFVALRKRIHELGMDERLTSEMLFNTAYQKDPLAALMKLEDMVENYGLVPTLISLHKNPNVLLDSSSDRKAESVRAEINRARSEAAVQKKYAELIQKLITAFNLPEEAALFVAIKANDKNSTQEKLLGHLKIIEEKVPKRDARTFLLGKAYKFTYAHSIRELVAEHDEGGANLDQDKIIADLLDSKLCNRPEAFIRKSVESNISTLAHLTLERMANSIDCQARNIIGRLAKLGIAKEFINDCMEKGMITFDQIKNVWETRTTGSSGNLPVHTQVTCHPQARLDHESVQKHQQKETVSQTPSDGQETTDEPEPLAEGPLHGESLPRPNHLLTGIKKQLALRGAQDITIEQVLDQPGTLEPEIILERMRNASDLIRETCPEQEFINYRNRFFSKRSNLEILVTKGDTEFVDLLVEYTQMIYEEQEKIEEKRTAKKLKQNGNGGRLTLKGDSEELLEKIRTAEVSEDIEVFFESRDIDPHEFAYVVMKVFGWTGSRWAVGLRKEHYEANLRNHANGAVKEISAILSMLIHVNSGKKGSVVYLKRQNDFDSHSVQYHILSFLYLAHRATHNSS